MPKFSSLCVDGVHTEDEIEGSLVYSLDVMEKSIDSDANEVDPLDTHE